MIISKVSQPLRGKCSAGQEGCHGKRVVLLAESGERNTGVRTLRRRLLVRVPVY